MSMFKFHDSNFLTVPNHPEVVVGTSMELQNGNVFKVGVDDKTVAPLATDLDLYVMLNIIDKPEILNTDDYSIKTGENVRAYRLKDAVGLKFDMSADLVATAFGTVAVGNKLVPVGTGGSFLWKVGTIPAGGVGFEIVKKTTFGQFTVYKGTDVPGGYLVKVVEA